MERMPMLRKSEHPLVTEAGMERSACRMCRDGNRPVPGPNGYLWHEFSGDDPEPCEDRNNFDGPGRSAKGEE